MLGLVGCTQRLVARPPGVRAPEPRPAVFGLVTISDAICATVQCVCAEARVPVDGLRAEVGQETEGKAWREEVLGLFF